jgi:hypothetical protein
MSPAVGLWLFPLEAFKAAKRSLHGNKHTHDLSMWKPELAVAIMPGF